jgi:hypothetical protein
VRLARESVPRRVVPEDLEQIDLVVRRRFEQLAAFDDLDPAGAAARAPARERYGRLRLVAHVEQAAAARDVDGEGRLVEGLEDDQRHGGAKSVRRPHHGDERGREL